MKTWKSCLLLSSACMVIFYCTRDFSPFTATVPHREFSPVEKALIQSSDTFGFRLFQEVCREEGEKNLFPSPLSVSIALGMTLNGAAGQTDADMRRTLGFDDMKLDEINASYKNILDALPNLDPKTLLEIANSIWVREDFPVLPVFISVNRQYYYAEVRGLDFFARRAGRHQRVDRDKNPREDHECDRPDRSGHGDVSDQRRIF